MPDGGNPKVSIDRSAQALRGDANDIWIIRSDRNFKLAGLDPELLRSFIALADGQNDLAFIRAELAARFDLKRVDNALAVLRGVLWHAQEAQAPATPHPKPGLVVIGNGVMFEALRKALPRAEIAQIRFIAPHSFASCLTPHFAALERDHVLLRPLAPASGDTDADRPSAVGLDDLTALCTGAELVICALEGVAVQALLDVEETCSGLALPCLYVTARGTHHAMVGPVAVPGVSPSVTEWLAPRLASLPGAANLFPLVQTPILAPAPVLLEAICADVILEAQSILHRHMTPRAVSLMSLSANGDRTSEPAFPPSLRNRPGPQTPSELEDRGLSQWAQAIERSWLPQIEAARPLNHPDAYRSVGILGGGTAGYLTALALRARLPDLDVTLIESSTIPVIGVGEATTPELLRLLHGRRFLSLDPIDFYRRVRPTWKLGIKFEWGRPGDYFFTFPFERGRLLESYLYRGHLNEQSLGAMLMSQDRVPVFALANGAYETHLGEVRFAYHLDNRRFVRYLSEEALRADVKHEDCIVTDATTSADGQEIDCLLTKDGRRLKFDLYIDCSGFRSLLMGDKLASPFLSYQSTLMTDSAIAAGVPHNGTVKPYTLAETMDNGWCWNIPFEDEDHRGYVFSSAFVSTDQAMDEMRRKNPGMHDPFVVRFKSGRHAHFWKGNVIAIGNAQAFVEPLESTAIHMMILELDMLTTHFPASRHDNAIKDKLNQRIGERWDSLRWFLGLHYKFNRRLDTPFWREANANTDISGAEERLALFRERAPLSYRAPLFYPVLPPEFFSDDHAFDTILFGQQVEANLLPPEDKAAWNVKAGALSRFAQHALGQREALELLRQRPEMLSEFINDPKSWIHHWLLS